MKRLDIEWRMQPIPKIIEEEPRLTNFQAILEKGMRLYDGRHSRARWLERGSS
jgi:hypothetical protein